MTIMQEELEEILEKHRKWLFKEGGGEYANLQRANLQGVFLQDADLRNADLRGTHLQGANLEGADLRNAYLSGADLRNVCLRGAALTGTDLRDANLEGADLDYSSLPLWCGSLTAHFDDYQLRQIAYHLVKAGLQSKNASRETKFELARLIDFANEFHRADECGKIT